MKRATIDRPVTLSFMGDWGDANLHRVAGWMSYEIITRSPPHTRTAIWNGMGGFDAARAVGRGEIDIGVATPTCYLKMAVDGIGPFASEPLPNLRGLAVIPQYDRIILGVRKSLGIKSLADLRERRLPLRIAMSPDEGRAHYGYASRLLLESHGIQLEDIAAWGGEIVFGERPPDCVQWMVEGKVDAVLHEAIMVPPWHELAARGEIDFLSFDPVALERMAALGIPPAILPAGYFEGQDKDVQALEFSDFLVFCRDDLPEDVAHTIVSAMIDSREGFERAYRHVPANRSPVTYPLEPAAMARTIIPLHQGAERSYREGGWL